MKKTALAALLAIGCTVGSSSINVAIAAPSPKQCADARTATANLRALASKTGNKAYLVMAKSEENAVNVYCP
jgi:hypothetical protein